jgi:hypothetical protein
MPITRGAQSESTIAQSLESSTARLFTGASVRERVRAAGLKAPEIIQKLIGGNSDNTLARASNIYNSITRHPDFEKLPTPEHMPIRASRAMSSKDVQELLARAPEEMKESLAAQLGTSKRAPNMVEFPTVRKVAAEIDAAAERTGRYADPDIGTKLRGIIRRSAEQEPLTVAEAIEAKSVLGKNLENVKRGARRWRTTGDLYWAYDTDIRKGLVKAGHPEMITTFDRANRLWSRGMIQRDVEETLSQHSTAVEGIAEGGNLYEALRDLNGKRGNLIKQFGKQKYEDMLQTAKVLWREQKITAIGTTGASSFMNYMILGGLADLAVRMVEGGGLGSRGPYELGLLGATRIMAEAFTTAPGRLALRNFLSAKPTTRMFWANRIVEAASTSEEENSTLQQGPVPNPVSSTFTPLPSPLGGAAP